MLAKSLLVLAASAYAVPVEEASGETPEVADAIAVTDISPCEAFEASKPNYWTVEYIQQYIGEYAQKTLQENIIEVEGKPVFQENSEMSFESMHSKYIEDHQACANTEKLEQALHDIWLQSHIFAGVEIGYQMGKLLLLGNTEQMAQVQNLELPAQNAEFLEILGLDHEEICDNYNTQEECDKNISDIYNQTIVMFNSQNQETTQQTETSTEPEIEGDNDASLDEAGVVGSSDDSSDGLGPSIFDNEDTAVGTGSLLFSGSLLLAGAYLL